MTVRLREIPGNYTSFSAREFVIRLLGGAIPLAGYVAKANRGGIDRVLP